MQTKKRTSNKRIAIQSNKLINARYEMTAFQKKIVLYLISQIEPDDEAFKTYTIYVKDFISITESKSKMLYSKLRKETKALISKVYEIDEPERLLQISMLSSAEYLKGKGMIKVSFDPNLKPYLLQLKKQFTVVPLKDILGFRSIHSMRIYEMLQQFKSTGLLVVKIEDLKYRLGVENKYSDYNTFKKRVIEQAQKELADTDMTFTFEEIKEGRRVARIKFKLRPIKEIATSENQEQLMAKLVNDLSLTPLQAKKVVLNLSPSEILKNMYNIKAAHRDGKIRTNLAAYAMGVFNNRMKEEVEER